MVDEFELLKKQFKDSELKRREAELNINKVKSELNSLRNMDKLWKNASKSVHQSLTTTQALFDSQMDQIIGGLTNFEKAGKRMKVTIPVMSTIKNEIAALQKRIKAKNYYFKQIVATKCEEITMWNQHRKRSLSKEEINSGFY